MPHSPSLSPEAQAMLSGLNNSLDTKLYHVKAEIYGEIAATLDYLRLEHKTIMNAFPNPTPSAPLPTPPAPILDLQPTPPSNPPYPPYNAPEAYQITNKLLQQLAASITAQKDGKLDDSNDDGDSDWKLSNAEKSLYYPFQKQNFSGTYDDDCLSHFRGFEYVCDQYSIVDEDRIQLLKLTLADEAKLIFNDAIANWYLTWPAIHRLFADEYSHEAKQTVFSQQLNSPRFKVFTAEGQS